MNNPNCGSWRVQAVSAGQWHAVLDWARDEGWDIGEGDVSRFFNVDPQGFFVGFLDGRPVASLSLTNFSYDYAHIGHYLVSPEQRGQGWGLRVWEEGIRHAAARTIGGDGMPAQEHNYAKWGLVTQHRTQRLIGVVGQRSIRPGGALLVTEHNLAEVIGYDAACTGFSRASLLADWFWGAGRFGFLTRTVEGITGLVGGRRSTDGYRLGPFYADSSAELEALFAAAMAELPVGAQVTVDAPETDGGEFIRLAESYGLSKAFHTLRMYRGAAPQGQQHKVRAIASLELG
ncbi:GNAT family N-acetyltransferase [Pseudomonas sp. CrR25]|nr:GNAT family N-acetyltransferase [Pseudomonas sp. CrR25]